MIPRNGKSILLARTQIFRPVPYKGEILQQSEYLQNQNVLCGGGTDLTNTIILYLVVS